MSESVPIRSTRTEGPQHTPGPWETRELPDGSILIDHYGDHYGVTQQREYGNVAVVDGKRGELNRANARLISAATTAPHECGMPDCPGAKSKRLLDTATEMAALLVEFVQLQRGRTDAAIRREARAVLQKAGVINTR